MSFTCRSLPGVRLYHSATSLPGGGTVVYGGRSSPLHPTKGLFRVTFDPTEPPGAAVKLDVEEMVCTGDAPLLRWRHTASIVSHKGEAVKPRFSASCSFISISTRCFSLQTKTFCSSLVEGTSRRPLWEVATGCVWTTCAGLRFARVLVGACVALLYWRRSV